MYAPLPSLAPRSRGQVGDRLDPSSPTLLVLQESRGCLDKQGRAHWLRAANDEGRLRPSAAHAVP